MHTTLQAVGITLLVIGLAGLVATVAMFFKFKIPSLIKDMNGVSEQQLIAEIRRKNIKDGQRVKINVFEELEKRSMATRKTTGRLNETGNTVSTSTFAQKPMPKINSDTVVLQEAAKSIGSDFVIEKNIIFVSTSEVI